MASRVFSNGNILTRTRGLYRVGLLKTTPLWLDVVEAFPPLRPPWPDNKEKPERGRPQSLSYPKDKWRRSFYRKYNVPGEILTLSENFDRNESPPTTCDRYVAKVYDLLESRLNGRDASQQAALYLRRQGVKLKMNKDIRVYSKSEKQVEKNSKSLTDLLDILS